jgi:cytochrome b involved in lipid metabolism
MAPDEDKLRRRVIVTPIHSRTIPEHSQNELVSVKKTDELKQNEVAIDGIVYDLTSFNHPGGGSIMIFGGNDVTVTYKMIHPHHTSKNLEKMKKVGVVTDYKAE